MEFKRNLKSLNNKTGKLIVSKINTMVNNYEKYKGCYFWKQTGSAASRRRQEFTESLSFNLFGKKYEWEQELSISCKNFYWTSDITVDGKKSNITSIKKILL